MNRTPTGSIPDADAMMPRDSGIIGANDKPNREQKCDRHDLNSPYPDPTPTPHHTRTTDRVLPTVASC
ncbi:MAG: hypothetical protein MUF49_23820 [Oculatellaceae cyanobacterium Prado106]|nr:hypothetical protein [Oculatellaceae cyanobacterium Prado106]